MRQKVEEGVYTQLRGDTSPTNGTALPLFGVMQGWLSSEDASALPLQS